MRIRSGNPVETPKTSTADRPATSAPPAEAKPTSKPYAPPQGKVVVKDTTGMDAPVKTTRPTNLTGAAPPPPAAPLAGVGGGAKANATVAVAFENIKAPGGPAQSRLLSDGLDAWNARMEMIEGAKTSIDASYFIMEKDAYGFAFLGGLLKKQLEGVKVRVSTDAMADTFGKHGFKMPLKGKDYLEELVNHGAEAYIYHPISSRLSDVVRGDYGVLASNHDKILVVDGERGITGGRNIAQDYFASPKDLKGSWRDMDVQVEGKEVAKGLVEAFDAELKNGDASHAVTKDVLGNWSKKDIQLLGAYEMMRLWTSAPAFSESEKAAVRSDPAKREALANALVEQALVKVQDDLPAKLKRAPSDSDREFLKEQALALVAHVETRGSKASFDAGAGATRQTEVKIIDQTSAASGQRTNNMAGALTALVDAAKNRIVIQNPYVVLTRDMLDAMKRADARGVKIEIITNSPLSTDSDVTQAFFLEDWPQILAECPNAKIYVATGDRKFHGKSAVIDDDQAVVSTYNLDLLSGFVNGEVGAVVKSKELAADLLGAFDDDKKTQSNGFIEYTIEKDANGKAVLKDGKPVVKFGPEHHLPREMLETYAKKRHLWGEVLRNNIGYFEPLRHDPISQ
ncbi:MAG: phosphatidylserine/phosphatidylglycerophosphate/cardiolipin synthase family protein [Myxococcota bacterium]